MKYVLSTYCCVTAPIADVWDVSFDNVLSFAALEDTVHPRYNILVATLIDLVNYCSDVTTGVLNLCCTDIFVLPTRLDSRGREYVTRCLFSNIV